MRYSYASNRATSLTIIVLIIIILLCLGAIGWLSYSLFRGGSDDGKIGINVTTGKCEVDIVDSEGNTLVGDVLDFVSDTEEETLYFHPGMIVHTEGFSVKNNGTVPIDFRVYLSEDKEVDMEEFVKAFDLIITNDIENLDTANAIAEFSGALKPQQSSDVYYLVIRMKEDAGNEFQEKTYTGIGVTVYAVQTGAEES